MSIVFAKQREQERIEGPRRTPRAADRISEQVSLAIGIMWLVGYLAVGALEPETHHSLPVIAIALTVLFHLALAAMVVGLVARRRWGITASLGASAFFLAGTVACPTTGHHTMGVWWLGQMAISLALVVGSAVALQLSASRSADGAARSS
jgi:hypothetical protein